MTKMILTEVIMKIIITIRMRMRIKIGNRNVKLNVKMLKCKMLKWNKKLFIYA